jgi:hypothetical protein
MSNTHIIFPQFRDEQSASKYPFADYATLTSADQKTSFAKDVFVDAVFYPIGGGTAIYIDRVVVAVNKITIFAATVSPIVSISATYEPLALPANNILLFYDAYDRPAGALVFDPDRIPEIYQWGFGSYTFNRRATEIVATAFIPAQEPGVRGLTINGEQFCAEDVCLVGDSGVVLRIDDGLAHFNTLEDRDEEEATSFNVGQIVRVGYFSDTESVSSVYYRVKSLDGDTVVWEDDALEATDPELKKILATRAVRVDVVGSPLFEREICDAAGKTKQSQRFLATINGCGPDEFGNFTITATDRGITDGSVTVLRVYPSNFGLIIDSIGKSEI